MTDSCAKSHSVCIFQHFKTESETEDYLLSVCAPHFAAALFFLYTPHMRNAVETSSTPTATAPAIAAVADPLAHASFIWLLEIKSIV